MKALLVRLHWFCSTQIGLDLRRLFSAVPRTLVFAKDYMEFSRRHDGDISVKPCLHDRYDAAGKSANEYFVQDLLVAQWIYQANPEHHVDVGSRIDGFVAHVASFREIEVLDIRPVSSRIPGVKFRQTDLMRADTASGALKHCCDSLSCLHALEHFGLGRYGDSIDPAGHLKGLANMAALLRPRGVFYLSTPIGRERVEFNANRIFDPGNIVAAAAANGLRLERLTVVQPTGELRQVAPTIASCRQLAEFSYNLGIFTFRRE